MTPQEALIGFQEYAHKGIIGLPILYKGETVYAINVIKVENEDILQVKFLDNLSPAIPQAVVLDAEKQLRVNERGEKRMKSISLWYPGPMQYTDIKVFTKAPQGYLAVSTYWEDDCKNIDYGPSFNVLKYEDQADGSRKYWVNYDNLPFPQHRDDFSGILFSLQFLSGKKIEDYPEGLQKV